MLSARRFTPRFRVAPATLIIAAALLVALAAKPGAQSTKPAPKGAAAAPQRITSTDPALRLKGFEAHQAMKPKSPFKDLAWQFLGPTNVSGRSLDIAVAAPRGKHYTIFVATASGGLWKTDNEATT